MHSVQNTVFQKEGNEDAGLQGNADFAAVKQCYLLPRYAHKMLIQTEHYGENLSSSFQDHVNKECKASTCSPHAFSSLGVVGVGRTMLSPLFQKGKVK